ncbi:MAG: AI-2E family transporter [Vampirovibrionales bacterium]|nr:AI-2E family transporter [Vampirovibrionales bacterium]
MTMPSPQTMPTEAPALAQRATVPVWIHALALIALVLLLLATGGVLKPLLALVLALALLQATLLPAVNALSRGLAKLGAYATNVTAMLWPNAASFWSRNAVAKSALGPLGSLGHNTGRHHHPFTRLVAVIILYGVLATAGGLASFTGFPRLFKDLERLSTSWATVVNRLQQSRPVRYQVTLKPLIGAESRSSLQTSRLESRLKLVEVAPVPRPIGWFGLLKSVTSALVASLLQTVTGLITLGFFGLLGLVMLFYLLLDPFLIEHGLVQWGHLNQKQHHQVHVFFRQMQRYIASHMVLAVMSTAAVYVGLQAAGVQEAPVLVAAFGVFSMVPWLGLWLGMLPAWVSAVSQVSFGYGMGLLVLLIMLWGLKRWLFCKLMPVSPRRLVLLPLASVIGSLLLVQLFGLPGLLLTLPITAFVYAALASKKLA